MKKSKIILLIGTLVTLLLTSGCNGGKIETLNAQLDEKEQAYTSLETENKEMQKRIDEFATLEEKYKGLSESEITAQTEANNLKAEQDKQAQEEMAKQEQAKKDAEAAAVKAEESAILLSDDGVNFRNLKLIKDRGIATISIENTTKKAKRGLVEISCLDSEGLQLEKISLGFTINALKSDIFQETDIPQETETIKLIGSTVVDK